MQKFSIGIFILCIPNTRFSFATYKEGATTNTYSSGYWRMLKKDEWIYLLNTRSVSHVRYHFAVVSGVNGVILYSDAYTPSAAGAYRFFWRYRHSC